ncbi:trehalose operon transcriptional repressor [Clostridium pasteurianum DSM 525 = ATCC 6013]|uniref:Trehalose operon repressor n=1 Tax=Clostridium pasteurianum DSM 525 = ATCC 6013 TaxID=1262449 RepID=A0A0H3J3I0_CLOPA|nr:trehalose operon repressor [Clostridium pasteurianum]AJA46468.1 trehalose operon transcriptional repressor [Clostridium pasteurianum DSM 525 = ATCC 6013]AJA50456.1 trehalose operon transcriptional repressor [Clostridium pasteurianum DSM 525 = ATCC 6013]AOZ73898.1 GntR family transcriptional regulator [Clostridium pasteurianum DSM 525 = ATCC 6013]AOZ77695.1 GntR family transcriptional regulator [Clostridium pasteurianum]ELP61042.1 GntR family transcriptional regulator [Clostridium pasteurian
MHKKYTYIYESIKNDIINGNYKSGEKLPSENDLCKIYNTSRGTVRRALDILSEEGLVNSVHGKGAFVLDNNQITFSFGSIVSFAEVSSINGNKFVTSVPIFEEVLIDKALHKKTCLTEGKEAYKLYRIRSLDNENIILDINYFLKDIVSNLTKKISKKSIYKYIEEDLNTKIGFAKRIIKIEAANSIDKKNLDMQSYDFVVVVKNFVYLNDGTQFEYTESRHRPDRFEFSDFARRR